MRTPLESDTVESAKIEKFDATNLKKFNIIYIITGIR